MTSLLLLPYFQLCCYWSFHQFNRDDYRVLTFRFWTLTAEKLSNSFWTPVFHCVYRVPCPQQRSDTNIVTWHTDEHGLCMGLYTSRCTLPYCLLWSSELKCTVVIIIIFTSPGLKEFGGEAWVTSPSFAAAQGEWAPALRPLSPEFVPFLCTILITQHSYPSGWNSNPVSYVNLL